MRRAQVMCTSVLSSIQEGIRLKRTPTTAARLVKLHLTTVWILKRSIRVLALTTYSRCKRSTETSSSPTIWSVQTISISSRSSKMWSWQSGLCCSTRSTTRTTWEKMAKNLWSGTKMERASGCLWNRRTTRACSNNVALCELGSIWPLRSGLRRTRLAQVGTIRMWNPTCHHQSVVSVSRSIPGRCTSNWLGPLCAERSRFGVASLSAQLSVCWSCTIWCRS